MDMNDYLSLFIDESNDHLQALNDNLLRLENAPNDIEIVQHIFRSAHTLKGMSATMGFEDVASLTHEMENVLDLVRNGKLGMNESIFDVLFQSLDALQAMVQDIIQGGTGRSDVSDITSSLQAVVKGGTAIKAAAEEPAAGGQAAKGMELDEFQHSVLLQSIESGLSVYYITITLREDCVMKAVRAYMAFERLERLGEVAKSYPPVQEIEQEQFDRSFSVYLITSAAYSELQEAVAGLSELESANIEAVDKQAIDRAALAKQATAATILASVSETAAATAELVGTADRPVEIGARRPPAEGVPVSNRTIRVGIDRLDALMNLFSELLIDRVRLEQLASEVRRPELTETVEHLSRVSTDLQNIVLKLRMVPVDTVFNRFPRMVRDLARTLDKKIELMISGAETELDRTVIDEIGDPLVHLLRNSIDHGIESAEQRTQAGKPETGTVWLRAYHSGNHVFIEIEDDGGGIDRDKVLQTALDRGIVKPEEADQLTEDQTHLLLFASGFSTADKVSDVSGRGVGLDVVRAKIESLGGKVSVQSIRGQGTTFSVQLPLTLSIISAMLVRLGTEKYAIPLTSIVETAIIRQSQIRRIHGNQMIEYRDSVIPVVSLSRILEVPDFDESEEMETEIVIIRKGENQAALMVDSFIGQSEIVLKTLGGYLAQVDAISGATILGDGQVALIIDPNALIQ